MATVNLGGYPASKFEEFKTAVTEEVKKVRPEFTDFDLARFFRARKGDVSAATKMILNHIKWYSDNNIKAVVDEIDKSDKFKFNRNYIPAGFYGGKDKNGAPIFYERAGVMDVAGMFARSSLKDWCNYHIHEMEVGLAARRELSAKLGRDIGTFTYFEDLQGLNYSHLNKVGLEAVKTNFAIDEAHYPEVLNVMIIFRAPKIFTVIWGILKPFIDPVTLSKIKILGMTGYQEELLKYADADQIPVEFGGTGKFDIRSGGPATEDGKGGASVQVVSNKFEVAIEVKEIGTTIYYDFSTKEHDIGFGILLNGTPVEPVTRYDCATEPANGKFVCKQTGKYVLLFDNSYSLFRSKTVTYKIDAFLPSSDPLQQQQ